MKKEEAERQIVESLKDFYGKDDVKVVVDIGSNTWDEIKEIE